MNAPTPIEIQKYLGGIDYPASRDTIVQTAEKEGADQAVLDALRALPEGNYNKPTDVSSAVSKP
ncbi:DUF2795 domain-containing protein [Rathayibacter toxicus]|uniref:DUF2795 domain-containing protein n=1 Tax=Rathayibacter toxicus TaxID=145458 RepID=A0A0C5BEB6_9MICO|nr:DUF2795 domain-containing protein [Rathayibacter toxicus]AJM77369.1 hypothetical protein TI83_04205 [Rathayibacter toxicus]ALS56744.1 hypothetical protein APU90_02265 [Rathayibacter toxicus]KKM46735.1 hypothetical protein VT73_02250 [Rathayibacter toxicus]PPG22469.1 DUF2795 domain-containing protein [Rathayibacter toxicus]PPG47190.1 DUF2795 domain-containing protein [Rathayibacter toxicus]